MTITTTEEMKKKMAEILSVNNNNNNDLNLKVVQNINEILKNQQETVNKTAYPLCNYFTFKDLKETLHHGSRQPITKCSNKLCFNGATTSSKTEDKTPEVVAIEAKRFLDQYFASISKIEFDTGAYEKRFLEMLTSIQKSGSYELTYDELKFGMQLAFRNTSFITDRWQWDNLKVFDARHVRSLSEMFLSICDFLTYVTNKGRVQNAVTVFPNASRKGEFRIWNLKLVSYAGYQQEDGSVVGDPAQYKFTALCESLGWKSPSDRKGTFDVLPLVLSAPDQDPQCFELPKHIVMEIEIQHPSFKWFEELKLQWFAVNSTANLVTEVGGLRFTAVPLCGPHLSAEVATRDLCDPYRYNILEEVAFRMGLDTMSVVNLWKDQALVEINIALLHSFRLNKVSILNHHAASGLFIEHFRKEIEERGGCPGNWGAIVPPLNSGLTEVYNQEMLLYRLNPCFERQESAWKTHVWLNAGNKKHNLSKTLMKSAASVVSLANYYMNKCLLKRVKATVVFASETGKSQHFAQRLGNLLKRAFNYEVISMDKYNLSRLNGEEIILIVTSTFGSGDAPQNGKIFGQYLAKAMENGRCDSEKRPKFAVFALGSSAYPDFCAFGKFCDEALHALNYSRLLPVAIADEIKSQDKTFKSWANDIFQICCEKFDIQYSGSDDDPLGDEENLPTDLMRITRATNPKNGHDLIKGLAEVHEKNVMACNMIFHSQLQSPSSDRQTILVTLDRGERAMDYLPGDHLGVFPTNSEDQVRAICSRLKQLDGSAININDVISVRIVDRENLRQGRVKSWKKAGKIPPCSIRTALTNYLDITTPPTQTFLKKMAESAADDAEKAVIEDLVEDDAHYESWKNATFPSLSILLEQFPSLSLDVRVLLTQLPLLQPRFYSISSSPKVNPCQAQLTVAVVKYTVEGKGRKGLCSNYLNDFPTAPIPCFVRSAHFRLPESKKTPVMMVGPGTGVAPFRGFWQQRKFEIDSSSNNSKVGHMRLYFGCRTQGIDDLYTKELQSLANSAYNFQTKTAFSREPGKPKKYVQHLLEEDKTEVYQHMKINKGHFYVCGEAAMAADVRRRLKSILESEGNMSSDEASRYISKLKDEGRFQEDIFGVLIKSS